MSVRSHQEYRSAVMQSDAEDAFKAALEYGATGDDSARHRAFDLFMHGAEVCAGLCLPPDPSASSGEPT